MKYKMLKNVNYIKVQTFDIKQNGIQIIEDENKLEIYNDPFRTVPLFITKNEKDELILFSNFEDFYTMQNIDKTVDEAGFWEIVLFGSGLWSRTLYKNVQQMPSASKIVIDKNNNEYIIKRYWDFNIEEDKSIDSIEKAAQGLYDRLDSIFSKLDTNQKYVMGMSGGMDSRITLAFLSKYIPKENLELFTYGFDERLLEYKYACEVAVALGYNRPKFHKLTKESYKKAMDYLPKMSGGQIGINHCHITSFLSENKLDGYVQISNYFSDALFGYDCISPKKNIVTNFYSNFIDDIEYLPNNLKKTIKEDSINIYNGYSTEFNYSYSSEYKYITERNPKFHFYLAYMQNQFLSTNLVFANYDLLRYMISIPVEFREQKQLLDYILNQFFENCSNSKFKNISSRSFNGIFKGFSLNKNINDSFEWYNFKFINKLNALLRPLTRGYVQLLNKHQTEEQDRLLYRDFRKDLKEATEKFVKIGLMNEKQKEQWDDLPLRSNGIGERFCLISLGKLEMNKGNN